MRCQKCNTPNQPNTQFCVKCGSPRPKPGSGNDNHLTTQLIDLLTRSAKEDFMMKSILVRRRHLVVATFGIFAALFFLTTPVLAAETPPAAPAAPPAIPDLTPEQKVARAEALSAAASIKATQALANGDLALAQDARTLACEAANLISGVADFAADTGNTELAQSALNASIGVGEALGVIVGAAEMIRGTSDDPDTVAAANALAPAATLCQSTNSTAQETAVAAGASMAAAEEAYEPPGAGPPAAVRVFNPPVFGAEPPITDLPPASPV